MFDPLNLPRWLAAVVGVIVALWPLPALADTAQSNYYKAYYLEQEQADLTGAIKLYESVVSDKSADDGLRGQARTRLAGCREEVATADLARLMPPTTLAYVELNQPGEQLTRLVKQLGLLAPEGGLKPGTERRLAISPALLRATLGLRGAAIGLTGFDPAKQAPAGVVILHPGSLDVIRGLLETALPVAAKPAEPILGCATFDVDGQAFVTLTHRLVIASQQRGPIAEVIERLRDNDQESLASSPLLADQLAQRQDALLFFCVNAQPIMPLLNTMMAAGGTQSRELAMAQALLDLKSFKSLTGHAGVRDDGLYLELSLNLDDHHRNLVYNFLRLPAIDPATLRSIPSGAAAFLAAALNEAPSRYAEKTGTSQERPIVTMLDLGREVYANINGLALFVLPPAGKPAGGPPIPDAALVMTVNDPQKSEALWTLALGLASIATGGGGTIEGAPAEIDGATARSFALPDGITIWFAQREHRVWLATSQRAIAASQAPRGSQTILEDEKFKTALDRLGEDTTVALCVHPARCFEIARGFMDAEEIAEAQPIAQTLSDTVASLLLSHSSESFRLSGRLSGIPKVDGLITQLIEQEQRESEARARFERERRDVSQNVNAQIERKDWDGALATIDGWITQHPQRLEALKTRLRILALAQRDAELAAVGARMLELIGDDAGALNACAWELLSEERYPDACAAAALALAQRCNELTGSKNWMFVDTLARARFELGDLPAAIELQEKAVALAGSSTRAGEARAALARYQAAAGQQVRAAAQ